MFTLRLTFLSVCLCVRGCVCACVRVYVFTVSKRVMCITYLSHFIMWRPVGLLAVIVRISQRFALSNLTAHRHVDEREMPAVGLCIVRLLQLKDLL